MHAYTMRRIIEHTPHNYVLAPSFRKAFRREKQLNGQKIKYTLAARRSTPQEEHSFKFCRHPTKQSSIRPIRVTLIPQHAPWKSRKPTEAHAYTCPLPCPATKGPTRTTYNNIKLLSTINCQKIAVKYRRLVGPYPHPPPHLNRVYRQQ